MGAYINPPDMSKEEWLERFAIRLARPTEVAQCIKDGSYFICLVDNGIFTAAAIMFNQRELEAFSSPSDNRPKMWFVAKKEDLLKVSDLQYYL